NSYDGKPVIISGDFNETPKGQMIKEMELDFINASGAISQPVLTHRSTNLKTQIDYVFTSKDWTIRSIEVLYSLASDHLPLVAEISMDKM
ncbi:MAG: endonuclease/exonuclease/phosphatase family protein, partial [Candidatus Poribacteria bacterium]|nr:endonuclease/exonuclease/phosphatase family protein [Candidatus Poribacteria bacterium]